MHDVTNIDALARGITAKSIGSVSNVMSMVVIVLFNILVFDILVSFPYFYLCILCFRIASSLRFIYRQVSIPNSNRIRKKLGANYKIIYLKRTKSQTSNKILVAP